MASWRDALEEPERDQVGHKAIPDWVQPMLATLMHDYLSDCDWIYEPRLDGERCPASRDRRRARVPSRNRKRLNDAYRELAEALARAGDRRWIVDGEIVALDQGVITLHG